MRVGSLFSGIGGIELGLERAGGFETAWFVENEPHAQAILRKHWPTAQIYDDVTTVDFKTIPPIDILTGGFPCQDISNAGKRAGITGSRSSLWKHYLRAISVLRPRIVFAENVSALTQRGLDTVLCDLAAIGYDAEWYCISASAVGAPHRRDRIAILAYPNSSRCLHRQVEEFADCGGGTTQHDLGKSSTNVGNADGSGLQEQRSKQQATGFSRTSKNVSDTLRGRTDRQQCSEGGEESWPGRGGWWAVEPNMGRVADGIPLRVDRIKRLGNAVVPQWAQAIGEAIKETEKMNLQSRGKQ